MTREPEVIEQSGEVGKVRTETRFVASNMQNNTTSAPMWIWKPKPSKDGFPKGFRVQRITTAVATSRLPGAEIVKHFDEHPAAAKALLGESYDKRYTPSTFISENGDGSFKVGWCTRDGTHECVKEFQNLADAPTDYLLFSLGKRRWIPSGYNRL